MLSDGQNRGSMTYPSTNSLSSGSNPARGQPDRTSAPAPTHTTISQPGNISHQHPNPLQSPMDFRAEFNKSPSRNLRSPMTTGAGQASRHSSSYEHGSSPAYQPTSFEASHSAPSDYHRPDRDTCYIPPISITRSPHLLTAPPPLSRAFRQAQNDEHGVCETGHASRLYSREIFQGSAASPGATCATEVNIHFPHPQPTYSEPQPSETYTSFSSPASFSFQSPSGGRTSGGAICEPEVTEGLGLNTNNRTSSSTTVTTTFQMDVNVTNDRHMATDTTRIRLSSIPMSNGTPPQAVIIPSAPGPPFSPALHRHHTPSLRHASMSISAQGSALELTAQVTYSPPAQPQLHSTYGVQQDQRTESPQVSLSHHATYQASLTESESPMTMNNEQHTKTRIDATHSETDSGPRPVTLNKKKKKAKMHVCSECQKEFPRPSGLDTHMNTHNNNKPYPCAHQGCDRRFSVRSNAKRHLKTHTASPNPYSNSRLDESTITPSTRPAAAIGKTDLPRPGFSGFEPVIIGGDFIGARDTTQGTRIVDGYNTRGTSTSSEAAEQGITTRLSTTTLNQHEPAFFKLRWVPITTSERSNLTQLMDSDDRGVRTQNKRGQDAKDLSPNTSNERGVGGQSNTSSSYGNGRASTG